MKEGIKKLPIDFIGNGEVKGFQFRQMKRSQNAALYEVQTQGIHYEVFEIRVLKIPKTNELYEAYPKANSFGKWAWTYSDYKKAVEKFYEIENHDQ